MIPALVLRFLQLVFGVVVLGVSITAIDWQVYGTAPATTSFGAFAGGFGILTALIGCAAIFIERLPDLIMAVIDVLAAVIFLAGGVAFAAALKGVNCSDARTLAYNALLDGGCTGKGEETTCGFFIGQTTEAGAAASLRSRCRSIEADAAFLFLGCIASLAAAGLCFIGAKRGVKRHGAV